MIAKKDFDRLIILAGKHSLGKNVGKKTVILGKVSSKTVFIWNSI